MATYPLPYIPPIPSATTQGFFSAAAPHNASSTPMDSLQRLAMNGPTTKLQPVKVCSLFWFTENVQPPSFLSANAPHPGDMFQKSLQQIWTFLPFELFDSYFCSTFMTFKGSIMSTRISLKLSYLKNRVPSPSCWLIRWLSFANHAAY